MPAGTAKDRHYANQIRLSSPVKGAFVVTPNDSNDLSEVTISLYIGTAGNVKLTMQDNSVVTYTNLIAGRHPLRVKRVWATGTTATGIIAEV